MKITVKNGREKSVKNRHPWLFSGAIEKIDGNPTSGNIVDVYHGHNFLGRGFYNKDQSIAVRFLTFKQEPIDHTFWQKRISQAYKLRQDIIDQTKTNAYRLIHGEGDLLPGLTIDNYAGHFVIQSATSGIDKQKEKIIAALMEFKPLSIYEKNELASRKVEKLESTSNQLFGTTPDQIEIMENGLKFIVDLKKGQKTGFFLDQRDNRAKVAEYSRGKKVLNCFSYSGGFSVYAAKLGAQTTSVDISNDALDLAKQNFALNNLPPQEVISADVFEFLRKLKDIKAQYDVVILDPPAFAKNAAAVKQAARGYKDINLQALQIIPSGGILVTCSCSQHIDLMLFRKIVNDAASDAKRDLQILEIRSQGPDHPINAAHPEGEYLKCLICRVI